MTRWLGLHVQCADSQDEVLRDVVLPDVDALTARGDIGHWFFLRHANGGPHLRVRLECVADPDDVAGWLLSRWDAPVVALAQHDPPVDLVAVHRLHQREMDLAGDAQAQVEAREAPKPPGTIHRRAYRPDTGRYGADGIEAAHDHFHVSSLVAASIVRLGADRATRRSLVLAASLTTVASAPLLGDGWSTMLREAAGWHGDVIPRIDPALSLPAVASVRPLARGGPPLWPSPWSDVWEVWAQETRRRAASLDSTSVVRADSAMRSALLLDGVHLLANRVGLGLAEECGVYQLAADLISAGSDGQATTMGTGAERR